MDKPKVAFICIHNSCRSQIAEALGKYLAGDAFERYSAGTDTKPQLNQDAVRLMKQLYGIDMEKTQRPKLLSEIPPVDIVITAIILACITVANPGYGIVFITSTAFGFLLHVI